MAWAPVYVTDDELANYLRIDDTADNVELALASSGASRAIDHATGRQFGRVDNPEERIYDRPRYDYERRLWVIDIDDTQQPLTAVDVDGTAVTVFRLEPRNAAQEERPWTRLVFTADSETQPCSTSEVAATTLWGWTSVHDTIYNACLLQASRFYTRRNAPFGVAGSPDTGSEVRLLAKVDPDVEVMLRAYRRHRAVG